MWRVDDGHRGPLYKRLRDFWRHCIVRYPKPPITTIHFPFQKPIHDFVIPISGTNSRFRYSHFRNQFSISLFPFQEPIHDFVISISGTNLRFRYSHFRNQFTISLWKVDVGVHWSSVLINHPQVDTRLLHNTPRVDPNQNRRPPSEMDMEALLSQIR